MRDLNRLYQNEPARCGKPITIPAAFSGLTAAMPTIAMLSFVRQNKDASRRVAVILNLTPVLRENYRIGLPQGGFWREALNSDSGFYGGSNQGNFGGVQAEELTRPTANHVLGSVQASAHERAGVLSRTAAPGVTRITDDWNRFKLSQVMEKRFFNGPPTPEEFQRQLQEFIRQHMVGNPQSKSDPAGEADAPDEQAETKEFSFDKKPRDVKAYLDRFVIKQEEAKKVLSVALCDHYQHVRLAMEGKDQANYAKQNVILLGPTGVGKTLPDTQCRRPHRGPVCKG